MKFFTIEDRDVYYKGRDMNSARGVHVGTISFVDDQIANKFIIQICDFMFESIYDLVEGVHDITFDNEIDIFTLRDEYGSQVIPLFIDLSIYYEMVGIRYGSQSSPMEQSVSVEDQNVDNDFEYLLTLTGMEYLEPPLALNGSVDGKDVVFTERNYKELVLQMLKVVI